MINYLNKQQSKQQQTWFQNLVNKSDHSLLGEHLPWFNTLRNQARQDIARLPLIQRKQEAWRYSHSERLFKQTFIPQKNNSALSYQPDPETEAMLSGDSFKLVFINGQFSTALSSTMPANNELAAGIIVGNLHDVLQTHPSLVKQWLSESGQHDEHLFAALNTALMNYGVFIYLEQQRSMQQTIELIYLTSATDKNILSLVPEKQGNSEMACLRNVIILQAGARLNLIERFSGDKNAHYFNNNLVDIVLQQDASLNHSVLQDESRTAFHLSSVFLSLHRDSQYQGQHFSLGAAWSRSSYTVNFKEAGALCDLKGLYTVRSQQLNDIHLNINHAVPGCTSRELYKGILYGEGRAVFDGHVIVDKQAQQSDASMKNNNLLLTDNAEVDTKPQLEIYADDVKCSHGTTVGQLDEEQLFYLRSRGIDKKQARKILCLGFADEIIDAINEPLFKNQVKSILAERLNDSVTLDEAEKIA